MKYQISCLYSKIHIIVVIYLSIELYCYSYRVILTNINKG